MPACRNRWIRNYCLPNWGWAPENPPPTTSSAQDGAMSFDQEYYERFYFDPKTAVTNSKEMQSRARLIAAYAQHTGLPTRRILDAGCGTGLLKPWFKRYLPRSTYTGIEAS